MHNVMMIETNFISRLQTYDGGLNNFDKMKDANFRGVFAATEAHMSYYNKLNRGPFEGNFPMPKEIVANTPFVYYFRKHSCLTAPINKRLEMLISSGIPGHFYSKYLDKKYLGSKQGKYAKALTLSQMQGIFEICGFLYVLATLIFLFELTWSKRKLVRGCMRGRRLSYKGCARGRC